MNIDDPLLTHAVLADFSDARFKEVYSVLHEGQSEKKNRRESKLIPGASAPVQLTYYVIVRTDIVPTSWVTDSVKEETLVRRTSHHSVDRLIVSLS